VDKVFIDILFFNQNYELIDFAFEQIDVTSNQSAPHELMIAQTTIHQPGFAYIFLSNEGSIEQQIAFDDYTLTRRSIYRF